MLVLFSLRHILLILFQHKTHVEICTYSIAIDMCHVDVRDVFTWGMGKGGTFMGDLVNVSQMSQLGHIGCLPTVVAMDVANKQCHLPRSSP